MNASAPGVRWQIWAFVALVRKGWRIDRRQPFFTFSSAVALAQFVLPTALATIALAGPNGEALERFTRLTGTDAYLAYAVIGSTTFVWTGFLYVDLSNNLSMDRSVGTLPTLWSSATARVVLVCGGSIGRALAPTLMAAGAFGIAWAVFRFPMEPHIGPAAIVLLCGGLATIAAAVPWAAAVLRYRESRLLVAVFASASGVLAGTAYPVHLLPGWAQWLSGFLPTTWMIRGLREALIFDDIQDAVLAGGVLLAMALAYGVAGLVLLHVMDASARAKGELEWM